MLYQHLRRWASIEPTLFQRHIWKYHSNAANGGETFTTNILSERGPYLDVGIRRLYVSDYLDVGVRRLYVWDSDYRRQILTSKVDPRTKRIKYL